MNTYTHIHVEESKENIYIPSVHLKKNLNMCIDGWIYTLRRNVTLHISSHHKGPFRHFFLIYIFFFYPIEKKKKKMISATSTSTCTHMKVVSVCVSRERLFITCLVSFITDGSIASFFFFEGVVRSNRKNKKNTN